MELTAHEAASLKSHHDHRIETYKSMISLSIEIFKYLALLNGGAVAGMTSGLATLQKTIALDALQFALGCFVAGLIFNGIAVGTAYLTQLALFGDSIDSARPQHHGKFLVVAVISAVLSLVCFCVGAMRAVLGVHG